MRAALSPLCFAAMAGWLAAAPLDIHMAGFSPTGQGRPAGWTTFAPRQEIMPRTWVDTARYRTSPGSLAVGGNGNPGEWGGWQYLVPEVQPGKWYRFEAWYQASGLTYEPVQVLAKIYWIDQKGERAGVPNFPFAAEAQGGWTRLTALVPAPEKASAAKLQLLLANAPGATVWWNDISFTEADAPQPRPVTVAVMKFEPRGAGSPAEAVRRYIDVIEKTAPAKTDVIVLGETITWAGMLGPVQDAAEPIPGPTTERLGELARARKTYIVAGLTEREGPIVYNTAVLIDREGRVAGKYHKVHLPYTEIEWGLTPGNSYPVFQTDFGKVGMMICWDSEFAEPAHALALAGAELILMPIWSASDLLVRARAIDGQLYIASSNYGDPSIIVDPRGEEIAAATKDGTAAVATIDLSTRFDWGPLGNMRERRMREGHVEVPVKRPGFIQ